MDQNADAAAVRGNPSFVWRAGQERRLALVQHYVPLNGKRVLDMGCGLGMYTHAFQQCGARAGGVEVEYLRAVEAKTRAAWVSQSVGEHLPFASQQFDVVFSNEVLEHVTDDRACAREMVRVTRPGGFIVLFVPNRLYPFETHGIYWKGQYYFGNKPLVNWLPDPWRNRLAPHVRAYTGGGLRRLFAGLPVKVKLLTQVYPGYDKVALRRPALSKVLRGITYTLERTPLRIFGLSHFMVVEVVPT